MKKIVWRALCSLVVLTTVVLPGNKYKLIGEQYQKHQTLQDKKKLFKSVGCTYFNDMIVEVPGGLTVPKGTQYYKDHAAQVDKLSAQYRASVKGRKLAPMYLQYISDTVGYGVFASKPIAQGDFIGVYAGILRPEGVGTHGHPEDVDYAWYYTVENSNSKRLVIDGKYESNELRFINHTQYPNTHRIDVIADGKFWVCYVASRNIQKDEQLTVHYGDGYWTARNIDPAVFS